MNVLVTGGTGRLGRRLVMQLRKKGHRARILSRNPKGHEDAVQGDLSTGAGLVKAVAGLGKGLGIATTAEGVETLDQLHHVRQEGCTEVQGYFFSAPQPAANLREYFARGAGQTRAA